jgi:hypothetical protein
MRVIHDRGELPRRCAWCCRFEVNGEWIIGRRSSDHAPLGDSLAARPICQDCVERESRYLVPRHQ